MKLALSAVLAAACACLAGELAIGSRAPDFVVQTIDGSEMSSSALRRAAKVTVVGFVAARCPVSNAYNQRLMALYGEFGERGVSFVMMNSNSNETAEDMRVHAKQAALTFPMYRDQGNRVADLFGAQMTPEMFVLDRDGMVRYHGAIDDAQNEARVRVRGLKSAIEAVLADRPVTPAQTKAFGCTLHRVRLWSDS